MAKVKVHELAKELEVQSKDILSFLQGKGIEAKAAQSSIDEEASQLVRKAFGKGAKNAPGKAEVSQKKESIKEGAPKAAVKDTSKAAKPAETPSGDAPKKKKTIIFVSNPQNSKMQGQRPAQGGNSGGRRQGQNQKQGGQNRAQGGKNDRNDRRDRNDRKPQVQPAVRIKPLTPPSPTPAVQMVPPKPQQPKARPEQVEARRQQAAAEEQRAQAQRAQNEKLQNEKAQAEKAQNEKLQNEKIQSEKPQAERSQTQNPVSEKPRSDRSQNERSQEGRVQGERSQSERPRNERAQGERSQGDRSQTERNQTDRPRRDRSQNDRSQGDRFQGDRFQGGRGQGEGSGQDRPARTGRFQGERGQGGYSQGASDSRDNRSRDNRGYGSTYGGQGGSQGNRQDRGQFQSRGGSGQNGRSQGDRQNGFQRSGRPGAVGAAGDRRGPGAGPGSGRSFNGSPRDGRSAGGPGGGFRDNKPGKGFVAEAPGKDVEKKREEEKRRANSQEKGKRSRKDHIYEEDEAARKKPGRFIKPEKKKEEVAEEVIKVVTLPDRITLKDFADKIKIQPSVIVKKLFLEGKIVTVNQEISYEEAENIAMEYEILCEKEVKVDVIEELLKESDEDEASLQERPPVICVMGHVDHGKTSLLDTIRKTHVTDREAGGITQHIGAYTVTVDGRKITFLDTPGHEAFTAMRMRGANSTDIAILVVAADDGVMPQTVEAISHAKAAGIEIVVAVNKIDKPSANIERVKQELTEYELVATDWGGNTEFVPVSAKSGEGIDDLLETILLTADIMELKANPDRRARGLVIEAELDKGRGPVATVLVQKGTLHVGDFVSAGACHGKVRAMIDDKGRRVKEAAPSTPVEILGLSDVPSAGEVFLAHENDKTAKSYAETYLVQNKEKMLEETRTRMSLDDLFSQIKEGNLKELNLIVKADVQGSVEAVKQSLVKLSNEEIVVKCIHGGVGAINESDVTLASASNAIIIGFNVRPDSTAKATAEREGVDVRLYRVIYQAIEDVEAAMKGMLDPVFEEKVIGHAEIRQIFKASQIGNIAGSYVTDGIFQRGCKIRITREGEQIYEGGLASLKRFKDDVKEVKEGFECGLVFEGFDKIQEFDVVEAYIMVEVPR
ncbi:MAG: translation initiation factor IF-2 [Lachnospiraceae bacterium]|nr:translation initiation factor IF-2 [Lachnospiraceae bacterium]